MNRDIKNISRDLEDTRNNDIIWKKSQIEQMLKQDPDILEVLGSQEKRPLNKYKDAENPTEEELQTRKEILEFNEKTTHRQIVPWMKLNGIQKEVLNFIMFDIEDSDVSYNNRIIKEQRVNIMCLVNENDMDTEYGITRADLLGYLVRDLLCWTNSLGSQLKLINDFVDIVDSKYYARTLKFRIDTVNGVNLVGNNRYDRFQKI